MKIKSAIAIELDPEKKHTGPALPLDSMMIETRTSQLEPLNTMSPGRLKLRIRLSHRLCFWLRQSQELASVSMKLIFGFWASFSRATRFSLEIESSTHISILVLTTFPTTLNICTSKPENLRNQKGAGKQYDYSGFVRKNFIQL